MSPALPSLIRRRAVLALALAGTALSLLAAGPSQASERLLAERQPFTAAGYKNVLAWSSFDPSVEAYRLRLRVGSTVVTPDVPPRKAAFDVNVGPLPGGRGYGVVYSRCDREATGRAAARGCDIYIYDVQDADEDRLTKSTRSRSEHHPALHGSFIAFARTYPARGGGSGTRDIVYKARTDGRGSSRRLPTPTSPRAGVAFSDIGTNGLVAYVWNSPGRTEGGSSTLYRVATGDRRLQRVYRGTSGALNAARVLSPVVAGTNLYWARTNAGSGEGNRLFRMNVGTRRYEESQGSPRYQSATYLGSRGFVVSTAAGGPTCAGNIQDENDLSRSECFLELLAAGEVGFRRATSPLGLG